MSCLVGRMLPFWPKRQLPFWKPRRKIKMQKKESRQGLALGAVLSLLASFFVGAAPASANENAVVIYPAVGTEAQTTTLITEEFDFALRFGTGVDSSYFNYNSTNNSDAGFGVIITKPAGVTLSYAINGATALRSTTTESAATTVTHAIASSSSAKTLAISLSQKTSVSSAVSITVQAFLDLDVDGVADAGEPLGNTMTVNFVPYSALGVSLNVTQPLGDDTGASVSFNVTAGSINWSMLESEFAITVDSTADVFATQSAPIRGPNLETSSAASSSGTVGTTTGGTVARAFSASFKVLTAAFTTSGTVQSVSATVYYASESVAVVTKAVQPVAAAGVTFSAVASSNAVLTTSGNVDARFNESFTLTTFAYSASNTTSIGVTRDITVSAYANLELDADSGVVINGTTYNTAAALVAAGFTLGADAESFVVSTYGQSDTSGTDSLTFTSTNGLVSQQLVVSFVAQELSVNYAPTAVAGLAGAAKSFAVTVTDQWGLKSPRTDLRVHASLDLASSVSTVAATVTAGTATVTLAPTPATRTGSATLTLQTQYFDQPTQAWTNIGNADSVTWNVYTYTAGTDAITSRTASVSASISYGVSAYSWSATLAVGISNSFSDVAVSAPGLIIRNADQTAVTGSDALTVAANGLTANFEFASRMAGTYTVTFTNGSATTTSQVVIDAAGHDQGHSMTFDKTSLEAGRTTTITGTLVDVNGNPVATGGTASVAISYTGAGLPYGNSTTMQTDADGKLTFQVLVLSTEKGDAAITAVYKPANATVSTANKTTVHALTIGEAASSADQKVNAGSFKGYVAVYAKGYEGQRLSAKVGNDWVVVPSLASNFERVVEFTGAGYTIAVRIYIDRVLVDTITVTTK